MGCPSMSLRHCARQILGTMALAALHTVAMGAPGASDFVVFDGQTYAYGSAELIHALNNPVVRSPPKLDGKNLLVRAAADGHFYVNGHVNGFPVTFLIDTGASATTLPAAMLRNIGVRAARKGKANTAGGVVPIFETVGNVVHVGPFVVNKAKVGLNELLTQPLLGQDVLNRFRITHEAGIMVFSLPSQ